MWKCWQNPSCLDENHYLPIIITITISLFFSFFLCFLCTESSSAKKWKTEFW